jgi:hypothetical protein
MGKKMSANDRRKIMMVKEKCWESDIDMVKNCDKAPVEIEVLVSPLAKDKIDRLMTMFTNTEWLAYLVGSPDKENSVTDIYIPSQVVSSGSVTNVDSSICNKMNIIGVIHSHHTMGNGFSGTDNEWINQNHDISLCISNNGINGQVRWKTPCGSLKVVKARVKLDLQVDYDVEEFEKMVNERLSRSNTFGVLRKQGNFNNENFDIMSEATHNNSRHGLYVKKREQTLEDELRYMEESGMFEDEDDDEEDSVLEYFEGDVYKYSRSMI